LTILLKLLPVSAVSLFDYLEGVQRLCALGFNQQPICQIPFSLEEDIISPALIEKYQPPVNQDRVAFRGSGVQMLDTVLFSETVEYVEKQSGLNDFRGALDLVQEPKIVLPENYEDIFEFNVVKLIVDLTSSLFHRKPIEMFSTRAMVALLVNGADVLPEIAIGMHRKLALAILDSSSRLSDEQYEALLQFLCGRVIEGWWDGHISRLFEKVITRASKSINIFILACLMHVSDADSRLSLLESSLKTPDFSGFLGSRSFLIMVTNIFRELISHPSFPELRDLCIERVSDCPLKDAVRNETLTEYVDALDPAEFQ
jgi:hypothetical protein